MATISTPGGAHPVRYRLGADGFAVVPSEYLATRFGFSEDSILVEEEVLNDQLEVQFSVTQLSSLVNDRKTWFLHKGSYQVFGVSQVQRPASLSC